MKANRDKTSSQRLEFEVWNLEFGVCSEFIANFFSSICKHQFYMNLKLTIDNCPSPLTMKTSLFVQNTIILSPSKTGI